ncbi:MAG: hypothetical protein [Podoviridae sp. ctQNx1]|nr:MAG: hypothetical protein [Podoviridae sp. ctQNx1]
MEPDSFVPPFSIQIAQPALPIAPQPAHCQRIEQVSSTYAEGARRGMQQGGMQGRAGGGNACSRRRGRGRGLARRCGT